MIQQKETAEEMNKNIRLNLRRIDFGPKIEKQSRAVAASWIARADEAEKESKYTHGKGRGKPGDKGYKAPVLHWISPSTGKKWVADQGD